MTETEILAKFKNTLPAHLGYRDLLSQKDLDQGDTSQRVGTLFALSALTQTDISPHPDFFRSYCKLKAAPGLYARSPNPSFWGHNPNNLSRDQLSVLKLGMVMNNKWEYLLETFIRQTMRLGFHQNTHRGGDLAQDPWKLPDYWNPGELSAFSRGLLGIFSYPITFILDLCLFIDLYLRTSDNWDSDNQLALNLLVANAKYPTPWSRLAMKRYLKTNFMSRLWNYHKDSDGNNGCEPLYWLFRLAYLKLYAYDPGTSAP